ncbi:MAG: 1-deoxy-D-xylulose-5-phosphate reductoisomerase, partial [Verrucomicrobiota bacterium]
VIVHPQSIVHSMVEFIDSSILAQLSTTDMCFPIQYAITWPERVPNTLPPLDFAELAQLDFEAPRWDDFPALNLAKEAGTKGGTLPAVMNAANEVAVSAFLREELPFPGIWETVSETMSTIEHLNKPSLDEIIWADLEARRIAKTIAQSLSPT